VATDAAAYPVGATATVVGGFAYAAGNQPLTGVESVLQVVDAGGAVRAEWSLALGTLLPGATGSMSRPWTGAGPAGVYTAVFEVRRNGVVLARSESAFAVTAGGLQLGGQLTLPAVDPEVGETLEVGWQVEQLGGAPIPEVLVRVRLVEPGALTVVAVQEFTAALGPASGTLTFATDGLALGAYLAVLEGAVPSPAPLFSTLDSGTFEAVDRTPPLVTILRPPGGGFLAADLGVEVSARDLLAGVESVELQVDGGPWRPMFPLAGDVYQRQLSGLSEGAHVLLARATDRSGNLGVSGEVSFLVDLTPPEILITGVADGEVYGGPVTPVIEIVELHPASESITLNGAVFVSGTEVGLSDGYALLVLASDQAGNDSQALVEFTIEQPQPLLRASKTDQLAADHDGDGVPSPGDEIAYEIVVENAGAGAASGVRLEDPIPAFTGLVPGSVTASAGTVLGEDPVAVDIGDLAAAATVTVSFTVAVDPVLPPEVDAIENQGALTSTELAAVLTDDPALGGASDPTRTAVTAAPQLVAEKVAELSVDGDGDGQVSPGDTLEYAVVVRNVGNTSATGVALADPVPAFTALVPGSVTTSAGTVIGEDPVAVDFGEVAATATLEVRFRVVIDAALPAGVEEVVNQGTVASAELADLSTDDPGTPEPGDPTVTPVTTTSLPVLSIAGAEVGEGDGTAAFTVTLTGTASAAVTVQVDTRDGTAVAGEDYLATSTVVEFPAGSGPASQTVTVAIVDDRQAEAVEEFFVDLSAAVNADLGADSATGTIVDDDELGVDLTALKWDALVEDVDGDGGASPGEVVEYVLILDNAGPGTATAVTLVDEIPEWTSLVPGSVATTAGTVVAEDPVTVEVGDLAAGASVEVVFAVRIDDELPAGVDEISNQGTFASAEVPVLLTDDPDTPEPGDPTVTEVLGLTPVEIPAAGGLGLAALALLLALSALRLLGRRRPALAVREDGDG
jgi:uncharacterized repeat protein (TIGR01451 family)